MVTDGRDIERRQPHRSMGFVTDVEFGMAISGGWWYSYVTRMSSSKEELFRSHINMCL